MKRLVLFALLCFTLMPITSASADWRWAPPQVKKRTITHKCNTMKCLKQTFKKEERRLARKIRAHNKRRLAEWKRWTRMPIAPCTWYGESGKGPQFSPVRYTMPNSSGSDAYGKYQMMPDTYASRARYHDWSPLDQEIAGHREYQAHGTAPWTNCTS